MHMCISNANVKPTMGHFLLRRGEGGLCVGFRGRVVCVLSEVRVVVSGGGGETQQLLQRRTHHSLIASPAFSKVTFTPGSVSTVGVDPFSSPTAVFSKAPPEVAHRVRFPGSRGPCSDTSVGT